VIKYVCVVGLLQRYGKGEMDREESSHVKSSPENLA
jgi:hypothetical protein